ncbi:hypothetical protein MKX01_036775 [Papaver californicum]|nr:hypothetical protein MKX01_036775 [Papaver californicum]
MAPTENRYLESKIQENGEEAPFQGDILDKIVSHIPTIHLVPSFYVSKSWQRAVVSCARNPQRTKPWLIIYVQSRRNLSLTTTNAYDPSSNTWIEIRGPSTMTDTSQLRSSQSDTLYMITPSKFSFSADPLHEKWLHIVGPRVWRNDPIVAIVGSCIVDSAATTWLSVAVSDQKMFLLEKNSGIFYSLDTSTKRWSGTSGSCVLRPDQSICFSVIGFAGHRLILVGLMGDAENAESLGIWEVNCDSFDCEEIGKMPREMFNMLKNANSMLLSMIISVAENYIYIYNTSEPRNIFFCDLSVGVFQWGSIRCSFLNDRVLMDRIIFTCSKVSLDDLRKAFWVVSRKFNVELAETKIQ